MNTAYDKPTRGRGHSLVELLAVISVMVVLAGLSLITFRTLTASRLDQGWNTAGAAVAMTRAVAQRLPSTNRLQYSGGAMIVCPTGEIRIVENHLDQPVTVDGTTVNMDGYRELPDQDSIHAPNRVMFLGLRRTMVGETAKVLLLTPPFAMRFNPTGTLAYAEDADRSDSFVYYDHDRNGTIAFTGSQRGSDYDVAQWMDGVSKTDGVDHLPFEQLQTVYAMFLIDLDELEEAFGGVAVMSDDQKQEQVYNWVMTFGKPVYLHPGSGALTRRD